MKTIITLPSKNFTTKLKLQAGGTLPVVKVGTLILNKETNLYSINKNSHWSATCDIDVLVPHHLYWLTDNKDLKDGDWYYNEREQIVQQLKNSGGIILTHWRGIKASTDKLKGCGLLKPEFVEMYVDLFNTIYISTIEYPIKK